tara:strand:- start:451 stop:1011 length:561 start_codon:yes stop_codon:yes gene_type:complete
MLSGSRGITIGDNQYPRSIYTLWTEAERNAINIYTVTIDNTNLQDSEWYINTNQSYSFDGSAATASYGTATAKAHADANFTAQDETDGLGTEGELKSEGLKTKLIRKVKSAASNELTKTDWYVTRKSEKTTTIPSAVSTHRDAVRTKQAAMETAITNASDTPALITLYTRNVEGVRPLGDLPTKDF